MSRRFAGRQEARKRVFQFIERREDGVRVDQSMLPATQSLGALDRAHQPEQALGGCEVATPLQPVDNVGELFCAGLGGGEHIGAIALALPEKGLDQLPLQGVVAERQELKLLTAENRIPVQVDDGNVR